MKPTKSPFMLVVTILFLATTFPYPSVAYVCTPISQVSTTNPIFASGLHGKFGPTSHQRIMAIGFTIESLTGRRLRAGVPPACMCFARRGCSRAVDGEAESRRVAEDARVSKRVMTTQDTTEQERKFRDKSNRTFERLARTLSESVWQSYGYTLAASDPLQRELEEVMLSKN